jgi:hypothetical protein
MGAIASFNEPLMTTRSALRPVGLVLLTAGAAVLAQVLAIALAPSALVDVAHAQRVLPCACQASLIAVARVT